MVFGSFNHISFSDLGYKFVWSLTIDSRGAERFGSIENMLKVIGALGDYAYIISAYLENTLISFLHI